MKIIIRAEKIYQVPSLYDVNENGELTEYHYDLDANNTDDIYYRIETDGELLETVDNLELDFDTIKEYAKWLEQFSLKEYLKRRITIWEFTKLKDRRL